MKQHSRIFVALAGGVFVLSSTATAAAPGGMSSGLMSRLTALETKVAGLGQSLADLTDDLLALADDVSGLEDELSVSDALLRRSHEAQALVAYRFDQGSGTMAYDVSAHGPHGAVDGPGWSTEGISGGALEFSGADAEHVEVQAGLVLGDVISVEAFVMIDGSTSDHQVVVSKWYDADDASGVSFTLELTPSLEPQFYLAGLGTAQGAVLGTGLWTHLVGTYDGETIRLYVDGEEVDTASATGVLADSTAPLRVGAHDSIGDHNTFHGLIDEVRIYDRPLSAEEIAERAAL